MRKPTNEKKASESVPLKKVSDKNSLTVEKKVEKKKLIVLAKKPEVKKSTSKIKLEKKDVT